MFIRATFGLTQFSGERKRGRRKPLSSLGSRGSEPSEERNNLFSPGRMRDEVRLPLLTLLVLRVEERRV
jgi:hypothetical protein